MPAISFPSIRPTGRTYTPGEFPQGQFKALNGATTILRYGNRRTNSSLELQFSNITDAQASEILQAYVATEREDHWLQFSRQNALAGAGTAMEPWLLESRSGLRWRFAGPPSVTSVIPSRSSVSARFTGYMDA